MRENDLIIEATVGIAEERKRQLVEKVLDIYFLGVNIFSHFNRLREEPARAYMYVYYI